jgi:hypothetical protein
MSYQDNQLVINTARQMLDAGFRVHPVYGVNPNGTCSCGKDHPDGRGIGKHPLDLSWAHKPAFLSAFPRGDRALNIALETGPQPNGLNLFGVDYDSVRPLGDSEVYSITRRGVHHYYLVNGDEPFAKTSQDLTGTRAAAKAAGQSPYLAGGVDTKYKHGALLMYPSRRTDGVAYNTTLALLLARKIPRVPYELALTLTRLS